MARADPQQARPRGVGGPRGGPPRHPPPERQISDAGWERGGQVAPEVRAAVAGLAACQAASQRLADAALAREFLQLRDHALVQARMRGDARHLAVAHAREKLELQVQERVDVGEWIDERRAHADHGTHQVRAPHRKRSAEDSAAALADDRDAAAGLRMRALDSLLEALRLTLGAVHVRRNTGAARSEAVALEIPRQ